MLGLMILLSFLSGTFTGYETDDSLLVMFWNMENFFDYRDGGEGPSDKDFSSFGKRRWTKRRFNAKCDLASKAVMWVADHYGKMPDIIGLCEVENTNVLYKCLDNTLLGKNDYGIVHYDSGDRRGIDVALLYDKSRFGYVHSSVKVPYHDGEKMKTRDILEVCLEMDGSNIHFIVNHHPSKFGGSIHSGPKRQSVMKTLALICDSIRCIDRSACIVAMGDFNDNPDGEQFDMLEGILVNKSLGLYERGEGTIRFQGKWDLIDMFLVSPSVSIFSKMEIVKIPFLMVRDNTYTGYKPYRTYSGPRYIGGVSDHCPIVLIMKKKQ